MKAQVALATPVRDIATIFPATFAGTRLWTSALLSHEEQQALQGVLGPVRTVDPNIDLVREGECAAELFIIIKGWASRYSTIKGGGRQLSALLLPGDMGNLDSLLFDRLDYGVRTLTQAEIVTLPSDRGLALGEQHPGIARTFTWLALIENMILTRWAQSLGHRSAKLRLAHLLCELSVRLGGGDEGESRFQLPVTQEQLADVLGLTSVHLNRVLQELRAEQLVATRHRTMILPDVPRLRQSCGFDARYLHMDPPYTGLTATAERIER